jgi:hypothetical protein
MKINISKLKIIAATSITIFTLASLFVATSAWFTAKRTVEANGDGFIASQEESPIDTLEIHPEVSSDTHFSYQETATSTYDVDKKTWSGDTSKDKFQLGTYSSMSPVHSTLLLIKLKDDISTDETLSLTISTTTSYSDSLVGKDSNNRPTKEIKKTLIRSVPFSPSPISNMIQSRVLITRIQPFPGNPSIAFHQRDTSLNQTMARISPLES